MIYKIKEPIESKIIHSIGRWIKRLFTGGSQSNYDRIDRQYVRQKWQEIDDKMRQGGLSYFQSAVLGADKLLDYCLKNLGAQGETMGERLKSSERLFRDRESYQSAWEGHKERNRLVHEHEYEFLHHQAKIAIVNFKKALQGLGVL